MTLFGALVLALVLMRATPAPALNSWINPQTVVQGGSAAVILTGLSAKARVSGRFQDRMIDFIRSGKRWVGLFGVDILTKPGRYPLKVWWRIGRKKPQGLKFKVRVTQGRFGTRKLRYKVSKTEPKPEIEKRIKQERVLIERALATRSKKRLWQARFRRPVKGRVISGFGRKTMVNGKLKKLPHRGVDLRSKTGTKVRAPARGRVILTGHHLFAGKSVYLDHGQGLITMYFHLSRISVEQGRLIKTGRVLGRVGSTGRSTGPHLHYGLYLKGARIDPLGFESLTKRLGL